MLGAVVVCASGVAKVEYGRVDLDMLGRNAPTLVEMDGQR
jgi:hypothetical protein